MTITGNKSQTEGYKKTYKPQGWTVIDHNLNRGANGAYVYLLYKIGTSDLPITDFYIKSGSGNPESLTHNGRTYYLAPAEGSCVTIPNKTYFEAAKVRTSLQPQNTSYLGWLLRTLKTVQTINPNFVFFVSFDVEEHSCPPMFAIFGRRKRCKWSKNIWRL